MHNITNSIELKRAIELLEIEQSNNTELLRKQFSITYENLQPLKLIENSVRGFVSSPIIGKSLFGTTLGMAAGFLIKKAAVGKSGNLFRNLFGSFLQLGVTNIISQHPQAIKDFGAFVFEAIRSKKEPDQEEE